MKEFTALRVWIPDARQNKTGCFDMELTLLNAVTPNGCEAEDVLKS